MPVTNLPDKLTRERVRQICDRHVEYLKMHRTFLPVLDRTLRFLASSSSTDPGTDSPRNLNVRSNTGRKALCILRYSTCRSQICLTRSRVSLYSPPTASKVRVPWPSQPRYFRTISR